MAKGKNGFILYADLIHTLEKVSDEQAGAFIKHVLRYVNDQNPETDDVITQVLFEPVKQSLKRDLEKWEKICERNAKNGAKGGRPKKPKETQENPVGFSETQTNPKKPDSDTDSDTDKDIIKTTDVVTSSDGDLRVEGLPIQAEAPVKVSYGNQEINNVLLMFKQLLGLPDFKESQKQQRQYAKHLLNLKNRIVRNDFDGDAEKGRDEFIRRFKEMISDDFTAKRCNSIRVLYQELKSVPAADSIISNRGGRAKSREIKVE